MNPAIRKHLRQIEAGHPVNWMVAERMLIKAGIALDLLNRAFDVTSYGRDIYQVKVSDESAFLEIESQLNRPNKNDRRSASLTGNSHSVSVKGAMLITWVADEVSPRIRVFNDDTEPQVPTRPYVLIIENEECFLNKEDTFRFVKESCGVSYPISDVEFVFGSGNSITNKRIIPYLQSTSGQVYCLFDLDFGGLRIFSNLIVGGLPIDRTHYLVPHDLECRLKQSRRSASPSELQSLDQVYGISTKTDQVISAIRFYKTTLEQESYRAEF